MGIRIDGASDQISAADGSLTIEGQSINTTGIVTATGGVKVGSAATIHSTGQFNIGVAATIFASGNATFAGIVTTAQLASNGAIQSFYNTSLPVTDSRPILQLGYSAYGDNSSGYNDILANAYPVSGDSSYHYIGSSSLGATRYQLTFSDHIWSTASAGTRGNDITWSEKLRLDSSGRLLIGTTTEGHDDSDELTINGTRTGITIRSASDNYGNIFFSDATSGTGEYVGAVQYYHADNTLRLKTSSTDRLIINSTGDVNITGITTAAQFVPTHVGGATGRRNMVINGACLVSQRYGTASVGTDEYPMDMFRVSCPGGHSAVQQVVNDGPTDATSGFQYSLKITNDNSVNNPTSAQTAYLQMDSLEASTVAHLNAGTSTAKKVTLSFWVKSSQTGVWGVAFGNTTSGFYTNGNTNRSYVTRYTVDSASTWEKKSITITLDTGGTWAKTGTGGGLSIVWDLGSGGNHQGSEDTWAANDNTRASGFKNIGDAANATWQITGIQLELGNTATPFEHETYSDTLARCQRYLFKSVGRATAAGRGAGSSAYLAAFPIPVPLRTDPTVTSGNDTDNGDFNIRVYKYDGISDSTTTPTIGTRGSIVNTNWVTIYQLNHSVVDDRVLTIYQGGGYILFDAKI